MSKRYLVAVDGSKFGDWAFHAAVHAMNPSSDVLLLVSVAHVTALDGLNLIKSNFTQDAEEVSKAYVKSLEARAESILLSYVEVAKQLGIKNYKAILGTSSNVGDMIVETAKKFNADTIVTGSRGLGFVESMIAGSVCRFIIDHATCDVLIVKKEFVPAEVHDNPKVAAALEEAERSRRLKDPMEALHAEDASNISHRVVVLASEKADDKVLRLSIRK